MEYASRGVANTALGLSIGSGVLSLLNGGVNLAGMAPAAGYGCGGFGNGRELGLLERLMTAERDNAILAADNETDKKLVDVYAKLESKDKEIWREIEALRRHQDEINKEQAVYNGVNTAAVGCLKKQVEDLYKMTKLGIVQEFIWPE